MTEVKYVSVLANHLNEFVAFRRGVGFEYRTQVYILRQLDQVASREMTHPGPVTRGVVEAFLRSLEKHQPLTQRVWLSTVRREFPVSVYESHAPRDVRCGAVTIPKEDSS